MPLSRLLLALFLDILPRDLFFASPWFVWPHDRNCSSSDAAIATGRWLLTFAARGRRVVDLTFVQNVVYAMRLATNVESLRSGSIYNISNHQPQQLSVMLDALLHQQLGLSYRIAAVPRSLLSLVARGPNCTGSALIRTCYHTIQRRNTLFRYDAECAKAITELGYRPRFSMEQGIAITGQWLREHGKNNRI